MLLLAAAGNPSGPVDPEPGGPIPHTLPAPLDATVSGIRPTGRLLATYTVGANGEDYPNPGAAITAAKNLQQATGTGTGVAWNSNAGIDEIGPDFRVDTILAEGSWKGDLGTSSYVNMFGQGSSKTELWSDTIGSDGTMHQFGPLHVEGIRFRNEAGGDGTGPKYPLHITVSRGTTVYAGCEFIANAGYVATPGSGTAVGMDGGSGTFLLFYGCNFDSPQPLNLHGATGATQPLTVVFVNCTGTAPLRYTPLSAVGDKVYVINCTNPSIEISGDVQAVIDPAYTGTIIAGTATVTRGTTWPTPNGGLSTIDQAFFYPSIIGQEGRADAHAGTTVSMTPTAGRTYMVPVDLPQAIHTSYVGITAVTAGGSYDAVPIHGGAVPLASWAVGTPSRAITTAGDIDYKYYYNRTFYPGETRAWVPCRFTADAQIVGSSTITTDRDCYYTDNGTTLVKAPAGMVFPIAHVRAV